MDCRLFLRLANNFPEDEENPKLEEERLQHAAVCDSCRNTLQKLEESRADLAEFQQWHVRMKAPSRIEDRLLQEFRKQHSQPGRWWLRAAAVVLLAIAAATLQRGSTRIVSVAPPAEHSSSREIASEFIPLYDNQALIPSRIVRVEMTSDALIQLGVGNVDPDSPAVLADVVLSEEGLPQAIRFVRKSSY